MIVALIGIFFRRHFYVIECHFGADCTFGSANVYVSFGREVLPWFYAFNFHLCVIMSIGLQDCF